MSRLDRALRRRIATALLLVAMLTWVPLAHAAGGGSLTRQYPLGTQTLCCRAGSGHSGPGSSAKKSPATPRPASATGSSRRHGGGFPILLVVAIVVIAFAPAAFIFRAGVARRGRRARGEPNPETGG